MPTIESWGGFKPVVPASSWVHPSAVLIGHGKVADLAEPLKHEVWISE